MTRGEAITALKEKCHTGDTECDHGRADDILCDLLKALGYDDVVAEYENVEKWYA